MLYLRVANPNPNPHTHILVPVHLYMDSSCLFAMQPLSILLILIGLHGGLKAIPNGAGQGTYDQTQNYGHQLL